MKEQINETKRMQRLAGIITESQYEKEEDNENSPVRNVLNVIKPNEKLLEDTGFAYALFSISFTETYHLIDFENPGHIALIKLLAEQDAALKRPPFQLTPASMQKGRKLFMNVLGEKVIYGYDDGADCTYRLISLPQTTTRGPGGLAKVKYFENGNELMKKYI